MIERLLEGFNESKVVRCDDIWCVLFGGTGRSLCIRSWGRLKASVDSQSGVCIHAWNITTSYIALTMKPMYDQSYLIEIARIALFDVIYRIGVPLGAGKTERRKSPRRAGYQVNTYNIHVEWSARINHCSHLLCHSSNRHPDNTLSYKFLRR